MLRKEGRRKAVPTWGAAITRGSQTRSRREDPGGGKGMVAVDPRATRTWERRLQRAPAVRGSPALRAPQKLYGRARELVLGFAFLPRQPRSVGPPPRPARSGDAGPGARAPAAALLPGGSAARGAGGRAEPGASPSTRVVTGPGHGLANCGPALWAPARGEVRPTSPGIPSSWTTGPAETRAPAPATPGRLQVPRRRPARPARP